MELYEKYVIELVLEEMVVTSTRMDVVSSYDGHINMTPISDTVRMHRSLFLGPYGSTDETPHFYNTYNEALNALDEHYYRVKEYLNLVFVRVNTVLDDIAPPIDVIRGSKINKVKKTQTESEQGDT